MCDRVQTQSVTRGYITYFSSVTIETVQIYFDQILCVRLIQNTIFQIYMYLVDGLPFLDWQLLTAARYIRVPYTTAERHYSSPNSVHIHCLVFTYMQQYLRCDEFNNTPLSWSSSCQLLFSNKENGHIVIVFAFINVNNTRNIRLTNTETEIDRV